MFDEAHEVLFAMTKIALNQLALIGTHASSQVHVSLADNTNMQKVVEQQRCVTKTYANIVVN